jgi:peptidoglycan/LPS O-acetylase OafA/YrhL
MSLVPTIGAALLSMHFVEQPCLGLARSVVNWHRAGGMEKAWQGALAYMKKAAGAVRKAAVPLNRVALH